MIEGTSIQDHVLMIIDLITQLGQLRFMMDGELSQNLILQSLSKIILSVCCELSYEQTKYIFLLELLNMLKIVESYIKKDKALLLVMDGISKKKTSKKGSKKKLNPKGGIMKRKKENKVSEQGIYFYCGKAGYWKKNCKAFLAIVKTGASVASKGMYEIYTILLLNSFISKILDIGYRLWHLCIQVITGTAEN